ncbi:hypothetical protein HKD37_19G053679 [Glycine soja]
MSTQRIRRRDEYQEAEHDFENMSIFSASDLRGEVNLHFPKPCKRLKALLERQIEERKESVEAKPPWKRKPSLFVVPADVSSIGACRPRIFFINGFLCFLEDEWQRNGEGRERGDATSRRR